MTDVMMDAPAAMPLAFVVASGAATVVLASALAYVLMARSKKSSAPAIKEETSKPKLDRAQYPGGHLSIYFASQTGTAETFGNQLEREGAEHGFLVHVVDLEDIELEDFLSEERRDDATSKALFLCSTYGEGEPTDNSATIVMDMKQRAPGDDEQEEKKETEGSVPCLGGLDYLVFGLGNTQYEHYNAMGKFFDNSLEKLGGRRVAPIGLGDDDNDLEEDFEKWKDNVLWPTLKKMYIKEGTVMTAPKKDATPETPYVVEFVDTPAGKRGGLSHNEIHNSSRHYFTSVDCNVTVNRELRSKEDAGSTVHVEIDVSNAKDFSYQTADNLGVLPVNNDEVVEAVASALDYDLDAMFTVKAAPNHEWHGAPFPLPISVRECLARYCDLTSAPRRSDLKLLASYATDPIDKSALLRLSSKEAKAEYREKIVDAHVGLVDLFKLCPSIEAPLEHFLSFCPRLVPRYYTISSSSSVHPKSVHLTVSVTETKKKDGSVYKGICSSHLAKTKNVRVFCRESTFRLPQDSTKPILMIGPGTGFAPMRALLQERKHQRDSLGKKIGANVLYFGCKKQSMDYIYQDEIAKYQADGVLDELYVAFSREQKEKVYVQNLLAQNRKETWELVKNQGAYLYVCGGVKMGQDVSEAFRSICVSQGNMSATDAKQYMDSLASDGRYVQELWA